MKKILLLVLLALVPLTTRAQAVTASTESLSLAPTVLPGDSPWMTVVFTNHTSEPIDVYGLGSNGPFAFDWTCEGGDYSVLAPLSTCTLSVRFEPRVGQSLGLAEGLVGFRLSSGTIQVQLRGFAVGSEPLAGVQNLIDSVSPLGFTAPVDAELQQLLGSVQTTLLDGQPNNDARACGALRRVIRLAEGAAADDHVLDWSAIAMATQSQAVATGIGCHGHWQ